MKYIDITPPRFRCGLAQCMGVYKHYIDNKPFLDIIGKKVKSESPLKPGYDEVIIPIEYFDNIGGPLSRILRQWGL
jgi:hypothetical protein